MKLNVIFFHSPVSGAPPSAISVQEGVILVNVQGFYRTMRLRCTCAVSCR